MKRIVIRKSERKLELREDNRILASWPIGLGKNPFGAKNKAGDGKTPEGWYYICTRNPKSKYYLSLGLSYPNTADAWLNYQEGSISKTELSEIISALRSKKRPPWNTQAGGEIMIHGGGATDWTAGCIAVENSAMDFLWEQCTLGMEVLILP